MWRRATEGSELRVLPRLTPTLLLWIVAGVVFLLIGLAHVLEWRSGVLLLSLLGAVGILQIVLGLRRLSRAGRDKSTTRFVELPAAIFQIAVGLFFCAGVLAGLL